MDQIELLKEHVFTFTSAIITSNAKLNALFVSVLIERRGAISHLADYRWASILHTPDSHPHKKQKCRVKYGASAYANLRNHPRVQICHFIPHNNPKSQFYSSLHDPLGIFTTRIVSSLPSGGCDRDALSLIIINHSEWSITRTELGHHCFVWLNKSLYKRVKEKLV